LKNNLYLLENGDLFLFIFRVGLNVWRIGIREWIQGSFKHAREKVSNNILYPTLSHFKLPERAPFNNGKLLEIHLPHLLAHGSHIKING
jgi:hypothetical protein